MSVFNELFTTTSAAPHGYCLLWNRRLVTIHVICDGLIALAYILIPIIIYLFVRTKNIRENKVLFALFASFILACALTHVMDIVVIWYPWYVLQGLIMAIAAIVSILTVVTLWQQMPALIKLPSLHTLLTINETLSNEIERRKEADHKLHLLNETLEKRVKEEVNNNRDKDLMLIQQSRLAAMGEMIGNIAHQWRQPINALSLVLMNIDDAYKYNELTEELLDKQIGKAERLIGAMSGTIDDFRNFFKTESSQEIFTINSAILDVINIVEASCRNHNIKIEVIESPVVNIPGFPGQYRQALLNIIGNAKDALIERTVPDGKITIQTTIVDNIAVVVISDNAGGIDKTIIEKVFDPYFTTRTQGNGIGLYMTKMIIENNMHGQVSVSNSQEGAVFRIETAVLA
jgi:signal transduction histidine kinase